MGRGTTPDDPVTEEQVPDLNLARHETGEYLQEQGVYQIFDFLMKDLLTKRPNDPVKHMKQCLQAEYPTGPLKVIVSSPPGVGRSAHAQKLAETFGLVYIGVGELLEKAGVQTDDIGYADEEKVIKLVMAPLKKANANMEGWVLDGFPRTRLQTTYMKEASLVPAHVLKLKASEDQIRDRHQLIEDGELEGKWIHPDALDEKLRLHVCHDSTALEIYKDRISVIDVELGDEHIYQEMVRKARMLPRSRGPQPPPRVVLLGPRGVGLQEHASRLAARLGAVLVDARELQGVDPESQARPTSEPSPRKPTDPVHGKMKMAASGTGWNSGGGSRGGLARAKTSIDLPNRDLLIADDPLGVVGVRLRQPDCMKQGWILCGFPTTAQTAKALQEDARLRPTRVVALSPSEETCVQRLRHILYDPVTGKVWRSLPRNEHIRKRLQRDPDDLPAAVIAAHSVFCNTLPGIFQGFGADAHCAEIPADGPPREVFKEMTEFVERPLPLPLPGAAVG